MPYAREAGASLWALTVIICKALFICTIYAFLGLQFVIVAGVLYLFIGVLNVDVIARGHLRRTLRKTRRSLRRMRRLPVIRDVASCARAAKPFIKSSIKGAWRGLVLFQFLIDHLVGYITSLVTLVASKSLRTLPWEAIVSNSIIEWRLLGLEGRKAVGALGHATHTIGQSIPLYAAVQAGLSRLIWTFFNSSAADGVADWLLVWRSTLSYGNNSLSSGLDASVADTLAVLDHTRYAPYRSNTNEALALFQQFATHIVNPLVRLFYKKNHEITLEEIRRVSSANALAYASGKSVAGELDEEDEVRIRLIKLHPGKDNRAIRCSLMPIDILDPLCPEFEALSYVWGSFDHGKYIRVDGKPFEVSDSLHEALRHIRHEKEPRILWIDALSINQNDSEERCFQVLLMGHIYSKASKVIVWLGEDEPFGLSHALADTKTQMISIKQARIPPELVHVGLVHVVASLLRRPWWTRVWVVQELVRAGAVEIQCGRSTFDWEHFCALVDATGENTHGKELLNSISESRPGINPSSMSPFALPEKRVAEFESLRVARRAWERLSNLNSGSDPNNATYWNDSVNLLSLVYMFRGRRATDPRDKVFAFMGLAEDGDALISPDYDQEPFDLSLQFAREHIRQNRTLAVVALAEFAREVDRGTPDLPGGNSNAHIPSWCPALMSTESLHQGLNYIPFWTGLTGSNHEDELAAADGLATMIPINSPQPRKNSYDSEYKDENAYTLLVQAVAGLNSDVTEDGRVSDASQLSGVISDLNAENLFSKWEGMADLAIRSKRPDPTPSGPRLSRGELLHLTTTAGKFSAMPLSTDTSQREQYLQARNDACRNRRLFVTGDGLLGLGPEELRIGDEVNVLLGMQAPVVLRRIVDGDSESDANLCKYTYLGQAYIHELMVYKGNLEEDLRSGQVSLKEILLI
ncbi:hypothetical protein KJ359_008558 [Pestalotiopsis sp. 9143b]|nr:hypothetical protein KJ359_008558 [Pestalotiopsis sp. 9143b]